MAEAKSLRKSMSLVAVSSPEEPDCCLKSCGCLSKMAPKHPEKNLAQWSGGHTLGMIRARLPGMNGRAHGLQAQIHYPAEAKAELLPNVPAVGYMRTEALNKFPCILKTFVGERPSIDQPRRPKAAPEGSQGWPIVLFSHGLTGTMEMYTQFCREMASLGAIVLAVEHQDGTAVYSKDGTGKVLLANFDLFPEGQSKDEFLAYWRKYLDRRQVEYDDTFAAIAALAGDDEAAAPEADAALKTILSRGDTTNVVAVGHSFGGMGLFDFAQHLGRADRPYPFKGLMLYDPWTAPGNILPREDTDWRLVRPLPWMVQMAEYAANDKKEWGGDARRLEAANADSLLTPAFYIKDTSHQWISESPFWLPACLARMLSMRGKGECLKSHEATTKVCLKTIAAILDPTKRGELEKTVEDYGNYLLKLKDDP